MYSEKEFIMEELGSKSNKSSGVLEQAIPSPKSGSEPSRVYSWLVKKGAGVVTNKDQTTQDQDSLLLDHQKQKQLDSLDQEGKADPALVNGNRGRGTRAKPEVEAGDRIDIGELETWQGIEAELELRKKNNSSSTRRNPRVSFGLCAGDNYNKRPAISNNMTTTTTTNHIGQGQGRRSDIVNFYRDRSIFITGATGFLGKATVEKILRTCPGIKNIYVLIRPKSGADVKDRLTELVDNSLYETLKSESPELLSKIIPIAGDITLPELGISPEDQKLLCDEVSVVIHSAATVKFDEKLKLSINVNVTGTKRMVDLCKRMTKLVALVHVSTAYANCEREEINEHIYPPPTDPTKLVQSVEWMSDEIVETITPNLIGSKPNTYTYTKALAEHILSEESGALPITIVRPSIVTATWKEPVPGWVDNINGPTGLIAACGKGVLRTLLCHRNKKADLIPLDFPVNLIIAAAWYTATSRPNSIQIYNCCSGAHNPLYWGDLEKWGYAHLINNPLNDVLWYPGGSFKSNRLWNNFNDFFVHYVPAYIMDLVARISGRKPIMLKVYRKLSKAVLSLQFFTTHEWKFNCDNMMELYDKLSPEDQRVFSFNIKEVNWPNYIGKYCLGLRKYVLKEDLSTLPAARKHVRKMYWVHKFTQFFLILLFWRAIMFRSQNARDLWNFMFGMVLRMSRMLPIGESV